MSEIIAYAQVILALALVWATVWYAYVSHRSWVEEKKPVLWVFLSLIGPTFAELRVENLGRGVANDIKASIRLGETGKEITWAFPSLASKEAKKVFLPEEYQSLKSLLLLGHITTRFTCSDILGKRHDSTAVLSLAGFSKSLREAPTRYEESLEDTMKRIPKRLQEIERTLRDLSKAIGRLSGQK